MKSSEIDPFWVSCISIVGTEVWESIESHLEFFPAWIRCHPWTPLAFPRPSPSYLHSLLLVLRQTLQDHLSHPPLLHFLSKWIPAVLDMLSAPGFMAAAGFLSSVHVPLSPNEKNYGFILSDEWAEQQNPIIFLDFCLLKIGTATWHGPAQENMWPDPQVFWKGWDFLLMMLFAFFSLFHWMEKWFTEESNPFWPCHREQKINSNRQRAVSKLGEAPLCLVASWACCTGPGVSGPVLLMCERRCLLRSRCCNMNPVTIYFTRKGHVLSRVQQPQDSQYILINMLLMLLIFFCNLFILTWRI